MKNNKALIPFIITTIIALAIIVATTYNPSARPAVSQVATTDLSATVSPATVPEQKQKSNSSTSYSESKTTHNYSGSYDNDYGYGDPLPGESLPDYIKREDPELYNDMNDRYDRIISNDYGYGDPKPGESFVDYMKREDPDLYNSMKNDYESMFGDW